MGSGAVDSLSLASLTEVAKDLLREILIENAMRRFGGNKKRVAEVLGVSRQTVCESLDG